VQLFYDIYKTNICRLFIAVDEDKVVKRIHFILDSDDDPIKSILNSKYVNSKGYELVKSPKDCSELKKQLNEFFSGSRTEFDIEVAPDGTDFQQSVWSELQKIPFGQTVTYGDIAKRIGNPAASRAVGLANNKNPIPIIIPCHRVIGANGKLVGFAGGLETKKSLLIHEGLLLDL
jgi:methylated-DNA-[protein]-cysteine S-methyltransferase